MQPPRDSLRAAKEAFCRTVSLKMQLFYSVVPKGTNATLTGAFVEELIRGFIRDWISPCLLMHGTLYPHDLEPSLPVTPRQIDGIVFDPRLRIGRSLTI